MVLTASEVNDGDRDNVVQLTVKDLYKMRLQQCLK